MTETCKQFTAGIYQSLNNLIQHLNQPDIQSVEALCIRFVGDSNGGRMLFRLLYWFQNRSRKQARCINRGAIGMPNCV